MRDGIIKDSNNGALILCSCYHPIPQTRTDKVSTMRLGVCFVHCGIPSHTGDAL